MPKTILLTDTEHEAMAAALDDEFKAHATYAQVIRDFGPIRPFINIVEAEARHISALQELFRHYGVTPPESRWLRGTPRFATIEDACSAGVQGEIDNITLYDRLLKSTQRPDIIHVFEALRSALQDRHLPAFRRCMGRGAAGCGVPRQ